MGYSPSQYGYTKEYKLGGAGRDAVSKQLYADRQQHYQYQYGN